MNGGVVGSTGAVDRSMRWGEQRRRRAALLYSACELLLWVLTLPMAWPTCRGTAQRALSAAAAQCQPLTATQPTLMF